MSDDLVRRAKESIAVGCGCDRWCETAGECSCEADAKRVIAMALEEAAKVCDRYAEKDWRVGEGFRNRAAVDLAATIRALGSRATVVKEPQP